MSSRGCSSFRSPSPFYRLKEEGLHAWGISEVVHFPPWSGGEQWVFPVAERCWSWSSSLRILLPMPGARPCLLAPVNGVVITVEVRRTPRWMRRGVEGVEGAGLASVEARTVFEGRCSCPPKVMQGKKLQGVGSTVVEASGKPA